jgi:TolA-binding protein
LQHLIAEYPKSDAAPEATYYLGVSRYKRTDNAKELKKVVHELEKNFPQSEWTKRASVYQLL